MTVNPKEDLEICNCIKTLFDHYDKQFAGGISFTNTVSMLNKNTGKLSTRPPLLRFKYYKTKDGNPTKKVLQSFISPNYCQFCGKHY